MPGDQMRDAAPTIERTGSTFALTPALDDPPARAAPRPAARRIGRDRHPTPSPEESPMPFEAASGRHARQI
ncbi:hypothetical protein LOK46_11400 [Methylobacterium sp. NMS14P]|uniref:hypothetical protein n=1 Tax=unclassified Methylobacterium TaxID=2615210 RepID=UPI0023586233|nr:hypothetical protein [Methylobacterium sp. NMS14P]WCS27392.1 hypothetical protein LOK46_11400 [Methylobacterium sp. NMS14P]